MKKNSNDVIRYMGYYSYSEELIKWHVSKDHRSSFMVCEYQALSYVNAKINLMTISHWGMQNLVHVIL